MKAVAKRVAQSAGSALWAGTTGLTDTGGGATDVIVVRHSNGRLVSTSFHAQLPKLSKQDFMGTRVSLFVNNIPTGVSMVLDRELICCFDDGSYRASHSDLESMRLRPGKNTIRYEMIHPCNNDRRYTIRANIHLWNIWDKITVVDIDGTVTKTDVAGFGAEKLGYEYIHSGVCEAVSEISRQGYRILFLTSRAITLAQSTREFLCTIGQSNGGTGMPEFCLITTTERFLPSLVVGVRSADKFKTVALQEILRIFNPEMQNYKRADDVVEQIPGWRVDTAPVLVGADKWDKLWHGPSETEDDEASNASTHAGSDSDKDKDRLGGLDSEDSEGMQRVLLKRESESFSGSSGAVGSGSKDPSGVFVCGFGNRLTDTAAYNAVGIPPERNFLIDQSSQIRMTGVYNQVFDGYTGLLPHIRRLLPALNSRGEPLYRKKGRGTCPLDCDCDEVVL